MAARCAKSSVGAAVSAMNPQLSKETRQGYQSQAADLLTSIGRYKDAAELLRLAARGSANAAAMDYRADLLSSTGHFDDRAIDQNDPATVVKAYYARISEANGRNFSALKPLMIEACYDQMTRSDPPYSFGTEWSSLINSVRSQNSSMVNIIDLLLSHFDFEVAGSETTGYHVVVRSQLSQNGKLNCFYLVKENGRLLISATYAGASSLPPALGAFAARRDWETLGNWLDWIRADGEGNDNPGIAGFRDFWPEGSPYTETVIQGALDYLSALFASRKGDCAAAQKRSSVETGKRRISLLHALADGSWTTKDWVGMAAASAELLAAEPGEPRNYKSLIEGLFRSHDWKGLDDTITDHLKSDPQDDNSRSMLLHAFAAQDDVAAVKGYLKTPGLRLTASDYNLVAWMTLFHPDSADLALEYARKAVNLTQSKNAACLNTLATLYAEAGRYEDARKLVDTCLALHVTGNPESEDWYVVGRIAEGYGFLASARHAYEKVEKPSESEALGVWELAQRRLRDIPE